MSIFKLGGFNIQACRHVPVGQVRVSNEPCSECELKDPEVCIVAAIRLKDGRVFRGHRHHDCLHTAHIAVCWAFGEDARAENHACFWRPSLVETQGFITSRNRFVDREEGLRLQHAAGIPSAARDGYRERELFSEDLY